MADSVPQVREFCVLRSTRPFFCAEFSSSFVDRGRFRFLISAFPFCGRWASGRTKEVSQIDLLNLTRG
jgi:hypothetical protein